MKFTERINKDKYLYYKYIMDNIINMIYLLEEKMTICWEKLIISDIEMGMKLLFEIFNDIEELIKNLSLSIESDEFNLRINYIYSIFMNLEDAMKSSNVCLIADLIKYEIKPIIGSWKEFI